MTDQQLNNLLGVLAVGCPLQTALDAAEVSRAEYDDMYRTDPEFVRKLHLSVAKAEYAVMNVVKEAATTNKEWRASVWWLERCHPERYESRPLRSISLDEFEAFRADIAALIDSQVHDPSDHRRVLDKLRELTSRLVPEVQVDMKDEEDLATDPLPTDADGLNTEEDDSEDQLTTTPSTHDQPSPDTDDIPISED